MKIGTITYWSTQTNYGQVLQCYALIKYLRLNGHEAFLIKNDSNTGFQKSFISKLWNKVLRVIKITFSPKQRKEFIAERNFWMNIQKNEIEDIEKHPRYFNRFRDTFIPSTPKVYTYEDLKTNPPVADAYICGSDQIWVDFNPVYYLGFGHKNVKRIAYAPSMGGIFPDKQQLKMIKGILSSFTFLSSREKSGVEFLHTIGFKEAKLMPDPTLLLSTEVYQEIKTDAIAKDESPYILVYLLGNPIDINVSEIYAFAKNKQLTVKYVASRGRADKYPKIYPTVGEWLELIEKAQFVITNSFHGTVFSLIYNTPFLTLPVVGSIQQMNNRAVDLLSSVGLSERIFKKSLEELYTPIDFSVFNKKSLDDEKQVKLILSKVLKDE